MYSLYALSRLVSSAAVSWLQYHSFSEPLSETGLGENWRVLQGSQTDVSGLVLVDGLQHKGTIVSRHPLETDTFRLVASISFQGDEMQPDDILEGQPGMMIGFIDESQSHGKLTGEIYGFNQDLSLPALYFALAGREDKFKPSISFGWKEPGDIRTPLPRGIYWNFVDKPELEMMLEVTNGANVIGHVRRKNSDAWTRAFEGTLEDREVISPNSMLVLSANTSNADMKIVVRRLQVNSTDATQPGFSIADPHSVHIKELQKVQADRVADGQGEITLESLHQELMFLQETILELSAIMTEESDVLNKFYAEQRSSNQQIAQMAAYEDSNHSQHEVIEHIQNLSQKFDDAERNIQGVEARISQDKANLDSHLSKFRSLFESSGSSGMMNKFVTTLLVIMLIAILFVITHMRRLEKKHIL